MNKGNIFVCYADPEGNIPNIPDWEGKWVILNVTSNGYVCAPFFLNSQDFSYKEVAGHFDLVIVHRGFEAVISISYTCLFNLDQRSVIDTVHNIESSNMMFNFLKNKFSKLVK